MSKFHIIRLIQLKKRSNSRLIQLMSIYVKLMKLSFFPPGGKELIALRPKEERGTEDAVVKGTSRAAVLMPKAATVAASKPTVEDVSTRWGVESVESVENLQPYNCHVQIHWKDGGAADCSNRSSHP